MKIFDFVANLLPSVGQGEVLASLRNLKKELQEQTIPSYQSAVDSLAFPANGKFQSKWCADFQSKFLKETTKLRLRGNYVEATLIVLKSLVSRIDWTIEQFEKRSNDVIVANGITFPVANLMQYHQGLDFVIKFSRKVLLMSYINETEEYFKSRNVDTPFSPADIRQINQDLMDYIRTLAVVAHPDIVKSLSAVPDVVVDGAEEAGVVGAMGASRLNPLGFQLGYHMNPIYLIRQWQAERDVARYEEAKAERLALELYLLQLQNARNGTEDAALERQIKYHTDRLNRMSIDIARMEEDL